MKKGIAFLLAAVMCLGFVGCGEQAGSAKSVYNELEKVGGLSYEAEYKDVVSDFGGKIPISEKIVFRMPNQNREIEKERACYIEVYSSADDLGKAVSVLNESMKSSGEKTYGLYSSGNLLLRIDGTVPKDEASKYTEALKKATGEEAVYQNSEELPIEKNSINRSFISPNGVGAREIYDALKKKVKNIEFFSFMKLNDSETASFFDMSEKDKTVIVTIDVGDEVKEANDSSAGIGRSVQIKNVHIDFSEDLPEKRITEYKTILEKTIK